MSKYKWRDLLDLNSKEKSYMSPLACVAHIDANAFFAQVEQVRCGYSREDPVVAVQWTSILAISYAARKYDISRMDSIIDALKKCDKLIPIHTAVFRKGEDYWQYHDGCGMWVNDEKKKLRPTEYKVALEPYRRESRKLLKILQNEYDLVEKASVDEAFVDLGRKVFYGLLMDSEFDEFDEIRTLFREGNYSLDDYLPKLPSIKKLQYSGNVYNDENVPYFEDWDDVLMCIGSISMNSVRSQIDHQLGYTTSCGISMTKNVCKLASNFKKPNAQTIVRNSCINDFLDNGSFEINSFWTLGGIRGQELMRLMNLPFVGSIKYIRDSWPNSSEDIRQFLSRSIESRGGLESEFNINATDIAELSNKVYQLVRGQYKLPIQPKPLPKSMMSNKNIRNDDCSNVVDCIEWLEVFCSELAYRVLDLEQEHEKRIVPRTMSIMIRGKAGIKHSLQKRITITSSSISSRELFVNATKLINEIDKQYGKNPGIYPLRGLALTISNFDVLDKGKSVVELFGNVASVKNGGSIDPFSEEPTSAQSQPINGSEQKSEQQLVPVSQKTNNLQCKTCGETLPDAKSFQEHTDFHVSVQLSERINGVSEDSPTISHAERLLLFGKRTKSRKGTRKKSPEGGILKFFKK